MNVKKGGERDEKGERKGHARKGGIILEWN